MLAIFNRPSTSAPWQNSIFGGKETKRVVEIYRLIQYDPVITQTFLFCIMVHLCVRVFWLFVLPTSKDDKGGVRIYLIISAFPTVMVHVVVPPNDQVLL